MLKRFIGSGLAVAVTGLGAAGAANAATIGNTTPAPGASSAACSSSIAFIQSQSDPSAPYAVPTGGGLITQFATNTTGDTPGAQLTFLVLRPTSGSGYTVIGAQTETITSSSGVQTFNLASPIAANAGDVLGLYGSGSPAPVCFFVGGGTPPGANISGAPSPTPPTVGQTIIPFGSAPGGFELNVAATVAPLTQDVGVTTSASSGVVAGQQALLASTVTSSGNGSSPITFIEGVPAGLSIVSAVAGGQSSCSVGGQTVLCTVYGLTAGQSVPVNVVVRTSRAGTYGSSVSVLATGANDPNIANNTASATLTVGAVPAGTTVRRCVVPSLKNTPRGAAARILKLLDCKVGKDKHAHSNRVARGEVIGTSKRAGSYPAGTVIRLTVSTGPARARLASFLRQLKR